MFYARFEIKLNISLLLPFFPEKYALYLCLIGEIKHCVQACKILASKCNTRCVYVVIGFVDMSIDRILTTPFIFEVEDK